ncbi:hypothetical protein BBK82_29725 [Lentzea guizhouensis]|uniref:Uncharacterized protein n=1 Tax=Lentzea guizhouensis TaxID=1586287 RepID=A0A1B2HPF8_9PSEU|nr:hypothetical protein [Lentzea guizhouensis]ANZ39604.1 hypothetical protein BBK82_29725 [Lentzea guizhouensis]
MGGQLDVRHPAVVAEVNNLDEPFVVRDSLGYGAGRLHGPHEHVDEREVVRTAAVYALYALYAANCWPGRPEYVPAGGTSS